MNTQKHFRQLMMVGLVLIVLMTTGCGAVVRAVRGTRSDPAAPVQPEATQPAEPAQPEVVLDTMSFVERNNLYLELLEQWTDAGMDTTQAEELYSKSLEASLNGDSDSADDYLNQAIMILSNME